MRVSVRHWLIRGLILTGVAVLVALGWVANSWVSPEKVREQVIASLNEQLDGVEVSVGSARMRILGGITVHDLKLVRRGAPPDHPFFAAPTAVLFHDKEQINRGRLVIRRVELENPELHLERLPDGRWDLDEMFRAGPADRPVPTFVAKGATLTVTDRSPDGLPPLKLTDTRFTLLNDPLPVLTITADATAQGYGPVQFRARFNRITRHTSIGVELPDFPLGEVAPVVAEKFAPDLAKHLVRFSAVASIKADLTFVPDATPQWRHDVRVDVRDGRLEHPDLPWPAERIAVKFRSTDGRLKVEEATARLGPAQVKVSLETRSPSNGTASRGEPNPDPLARVEEHLQRLDVTATGVPLDDRLFARLGDLGAKAKRMLSPTGSIELGYRFTREAGGWKREYDFRPQSVGITCEKFKYPVTEVQGSVKRTVTQVGGLTTLFDLRGRLAGQPVTLKGQVTGPGPDAINLRLAATNLPIDDTLVAALPDRYPDLIRQFRATGRADVVAEFVQQPGVNLCEREIRVDIRDAAVNYVQFPLKFEKVNGRVVVRVATSDPDRPPPPGEPPGQPVDREELFLEGFTGIHAGAPIRLNGWKRAVPGGHDRKLVLHADGRGVPVDADLRTAFGALKLDSIWPTFAPTGTLTFGTVIEVLDRGPPPLAPVGRPDAKPPEDIPFEPATDLKVTLNFFGPTATPSFFPYEIADLSGWLEYKSGRLDLAHFAGRHGESRLRLEAGEVRFYPDGVVWANLGGRNGGLEIKPFVADAALLKALPEKLRDAAAGLKLKGGAEVSMKQLVVLTPPDPPSGVLPPPEPLPIGPATPLTPRGQAPELAAGPQPFPAGPVPPPTRAPSPPPQPDPVIYWDGELKLTGASLDTGVTWDDLYGAVACRGRYEGTHLGLVRGNIWLDRGVVTRLPVSALKAQIRATPQQPDPTRPGQFLPPELEFLGGSASLFHGAAGGEARVVLADTPRYELWLSATDVQLDEVARHYKLGSDADLKGIAQAQLRLFNRPDPKTGRWAVEGVGKVDVPTGRMYNLPVLLDLVKVLKLSTPDKTAFEEAHATVHIQGDRIRVDQLDLIGKAVCVGGSGEVDTSGEYVRFEFYTLGSEILARMVNTPVGDLSALISRGLLKIKMTRENGELKYKPEPLPVVTEPARAITDRLKGRFGKTPASGK
jgi:hypothetical protein